MKKLISRAFVAENTGSLILAGFFCLLVFTLGQLWQLDLSVSQEERYWIYPSLAPEQVRNELQRLSAETAAKPAELVRIYELQSAIHKLYGSCRKAELQLGRPAIGCQSIIQLEPALMEQISGKYLPGYAARAQESFHRQNPEAENFRIGGSLSGRMSPGYRNREAALLARLMWQWVCWFWAGGLLAVHRYVYLNRQLGRKLWMELVVPWRFPLAVAGYPLFLKWYPEKYPMQKVRQLLGYAAYALSIVLSCGFIGPLKAQTKKDGDEGKKRGAEYSLNVDLRQTLPVGDGPPTPENFLKLRLENPTPVVVQHTSVVRSDRSWAQYLQGIFKAVKTRRLDIRPYGGLLVSSSAQAAFRDTSILAGSELVLRWKGLVSSSPFLHLDMPTGSGKKSLVWVNQTTVSLPRGLLAGFSTSLKKARGQPASWKIGPVAGKKIRSWTFEVLVLIDPATGNTGIRGRVVVPVPIR